MNLITLKFSYQLSDSPFLHVIRTMTHKVFVYGTLKLNEPNHSWLLNREKGSSKYISNGVTKSKYPLIIATKYNIPFILYQPGEGLHVHGEIYEVDDSMLAHLDILEDHPNYYVREIDEVLCKRVGVKDEIVKCWIYFLKAFKPQLLTYPFLDSYSSMGSHGKPYMESNNESTREDIDEDELNSVHPQ